MKKILMFVVASLVIATISCKKDQAIQPKVKAASTGLAKPAKSNVQTTYNYHLAIMAKHTVNK